MGFFDDLNESWKKKNDEIRKEYAEEMEEMRYCDAEELKHERIRGSLTHRRVAGDLLRSMGYKV